MIVVGGVALLLFVVALVMARAEILELSVTTTAETRCEFSDLPEDMCAHCQGHVIPEPARGFHAGSGGLVAQYDGFCARCGERIHPGESIERRGEDWRHVNCDA